MRRILPVLMMVVLALGCGTKDEKTGDDQLYVVCTTGMIADAARQIMGDKATVVALMGPGVDPHLYKATQGDLSELRKADIIIYNGLHLEGKMVEIFDELGKDKPVIAVSDGIDEKRFRTVAQVSGVPTHDPHIWFDVLLWSEGVKYVGSKVAEIDPDNAAYYNQQTDSYIGKLKTLDDEVRAKMNGIPEENRILITSHDAFGYFGQAYDIDVHGLQGISTAAEFGLKDITDMVDMIIRLKVKAVFVESSVSEKSIRAVMEGCKQKGHIVQPGGTLFSDAMGAADTPEGNYIGMVTHNANAIAQALK